MNFLHLLVDFYIKYQKFEIKILCLKSELDIHVPILRNLIILNIFLIGPT